MKFSFHSIALKDIDGQEMKESHANKTLAFVIYRFTKNLDLVEKAMQMNRGEDVEFSKEELKEVESMIDLPAGAIASFVRKALHDYIASVQVK